MDPVRERAQRELRAVVRLALRARAAEDAMLALGPAASRKEAETILRDTENLRAFALDRARELYRWLALHAPELRAR